MQSQNYSFDSGDEESRQPMTYRELKALAIRINQLPVEGLATVVSIVERREPQENENVNPDELDIDFENLRPKTARELLAFVNAAMPIPAVPVVAPDSSTARTPSHCNQPNIEADQPKNTSEY